MPAIEVPCSEYKFRSIVEQSADGVVLADKTGTFIEWNSSMERLTGLKRSEVVGKPAADILFSLLPPEYQSAQLLEEYRANIRHLAATREGSWMNRVMEQCVQNTDGKRWHAEQQAFVIELNEGSLLCAIIRDITERKQQEEALRFQAHLLDMVGQSVIATSLDGTITWLKQSTGLLVEHHKFLNIILTSGEHLLTLINNVLDLSRIEVGQITLQPTSFDLFNLLAGVRDMFRLRAEEKGIALALDIAPNVPRTIHADQMKLRQVLINLLSNAIKFTQEGSVQLKVEVAERSPTSEVQRGTADEGPQTVDKHRTPAAGVDTTVQDNVVQTYPPLSASEGGVLYEDTNPQMLLRFQVADTGSGIAAEEPGHLFEAFVQTASGIQSGEGTGPGLAISRTFVQLMGGEITVESAVGRGTVFHFAIAVNEVVSDDSQHRSEQQRIVGLTPGQPAYRVLVVDDRSESLQLIRELLVPVSFHVREAFNGEDALAIWETWQPHIIFMDMRMPVMDGYAATQRIKASSANQSNRDNSGDGQCI